VIFTSPDFRQRVTDVYEELLNVWNTTDETTIIDIIDGDREYKNMCLVSLSMPNNSQNGESLFFDASFEEIRIFSKSYVDAKYLKEGTKASKGVKTDSAPKKDLGSQTKAPVSEKKVSIVKGLFNKAVK
jgi:hypothetical protein